MSISNESVFHKPKKWSEDKTVRLIRAFRSKPVLWDPQHQMHFKKSAKPAMWNEVAIELNSSPTKCKNKIVNLMSGFRREKAKMLRVLASVGGNWSEGNYDIEIKYLKSYLQIIRCYSCEVL